MTKIEECNNHVNSALEFYSFLAWGCFNYSSLGFSRFDEQILESGF